MNDIYILVLINKLKDIYYQTAVLSSSICHIPSVKTVVMKHMYHMDRSGPHPLCWRVWVSSVARMRTAPDTTHPYQVNGKHLDQSQKYNCFPFKIKAQINILKQILECVERQIF